MRSAGIKQVVVLRQTAWLVPRRWLLSRGEMLRIIDKFLLALWLSHARRGLECNSNRRHLARGTQSLLHLLLELLSGLENVFTCCLLERFYLSIICTNNNNLNHLISFSVCLTFSVYWIIATSNLQACVCVLKHIHWLDDLLVSQLNGTGIWNQQRNTLWTAFGPCCRGQASEPQVKTEVWIIVEAARYFV